MTRKCAEITAATTKRVCKLKDDNKKMTISDIKSIIKREFGVIIGSSTVCEILKEEKMAKLCWRPIQN